MDAKKSLNVNIFLRQFRVSHSELVNYVRTAVPGNASSTVDGESNRGLGLIEMGVERLRGLHKVLPEPDELEILRAYTGDVARLGNAEKFYLEISKLNEYAEFVHHKLLYYCIKLLTITVLPLYSSTLYSEDFVAGELIWVGESHVDYA